jgi:hypothetical protein
MVQSKLVTNFGYRSPIYAVGDTATMRQAAPSFHKFHNIHYANNSEPIVPNASAVDGDLAYSAEAANA